MSMSNDRIDAKKKAMLKALQKSYGIVTRAAEAAGVARCVHYKWLKEDEEYRQSAEDIQEAKLDLIEMALVRRIEDGDTPAIIFAMKCLGKNRGYREKSEVDLNVGFDPEKPFEIKFGE